MVLVAQNLTDGSAVRNRCLTVPNLTSVRDVQMAVQRLVRLKGRPLDNIVPAGVDYRAGENHLLITSGG